MLMSIPTWRMRRSTPDHMIRSLGLILLITQSVSAQCSTEWTMRSEEGPRPRQDHAMAYNSTQGVVVLQGGVSGFPNESDLWKWNGEVWSRLPGLLYRDHHAMAYDERHGLLVVFGGYDFDGLEPNEETWAHDGERWTLLTSAGPNGRAGHAMVYDSWRGVIVMFGGGPHPIGDTWELYPTGWRRASITGPSRRTDLAMAFDSDRGVTVLYGGSGDPVGETWEWDGIEWTLISTSGPGPRAGYTMSYDSHRKRTVLVGGHPLLETWEWDGQQWTELPSSAPRGRFGLASAFDEQRGKLVMFGGFSSGASYLNDTWEYGLPNPFLIVDATCPTGGAMSIRWSCATPDKTAALVYSPAHGMFTIPNNQPCAGTALDLNPSGLQLVWTGRTGHDGSGVIRTQAGPPACGSYLQFIDVDSCRVSAAVRVN